MFQDFKFKSKKNPVARVQKDDSDEIAWKAVLCLNFCGCTMSGPQIAQGDT